MELKFKLCEGCGAKKRAEAFQFTRSGTRMVRCRVCVSKRTAANRVPSHLKRKVPGEFHGFRAFVPEPDDLRERAAVEFCRRMAGTLDKPHLRPALTIAGVVVSEADRRALLSRRVRFHRQRQGA